MVEEPLGISTNLSQSLSTNKRGKVVRTKEKEEAATRRTTKSLKALTRENLSNTRSQELSQINLSSLISRICSKWISLRCKNFLSMSSRCTVLISQLKLAEITLSRMLLMGCKTFLEHLEEDNLQVLGAEAEEELKEAIIEEGVLKVVDMVAEVVIKIRTGIITTKALKWHNNQTYLAYW